MSISAAKKAELSASEIILPWPPAALSPNARLHWRALDRAKKAYKAECLWRLDGQCVPKIHNDENILLTITLHPPDRRKRDRDNMQSALKYGLDSLAVRLLVDDYRFEPTYRFSEPVKGGKVVITIGDAS